MLKHVWLFCDLHALYTTGSSAWDFPGKNTGVGCHFLFQELFWTQGSNLHLLHWQKDSLPLNHQESPSCGIYWYKIAYNITFLFLVYMKSRVILLHSFLTLLSYIYIYFPKLVQLEVHQNLLIFPKSQPLISVNFHYFFPSFSLSFWFLFLFVFFLLLPLDFICCTLSDCLMLR